MPASLVPCFFRCLWFGHNSKARISVSSWSSGSPITPITRHFTWFYHLLFTSFHLFSVHPHVVPPAVLVTLKPPIFTTHFQSLPHPHSRHCVFLHTLFTSFRLSSCSPAPRAPPLPRPAARCWAAGLRCVWWEGGGLVFGSRPVVPPPHMPVLLPAGVVCRIVSRVVPE